MVPRFLHMDFISRKILDKQFVCKIYPLTSQKALIKIKCQGKSETYYYNFSSIPSSKTESLNVGFKSVIRAHSLPEPPHSCHGDERDKRHRQAGQQQRCVSVQAEGDVRSRRPPTPAAHGWGRRRRRRRMMPCLFIITSTV